MQTALALDTPCLSSVIPEIGELLSEKLSTDGAVISRQILTDLFTLKTGESDASGRWSMRDAYTALEFAQILTVPRWMAEAEMSGVPRPDLFAKVEQQIKRLAARLPTQSYRSENQIELQQFSTPLWLAWVANEAATISPTDIVLEPSAGTGLLALRASCVGASLILNEIDNVRRTCLAAGFPNAVITAFNGAIIDDVLRQDIKPSVVLMNPPFSRSVGRGVDRHAAMRHLSSAFKRLRTGGRLVAIMPPSWTLDRMLSETEVLTLRASIGVSGGFLKHGTSFDTRLVVIDKIKDPAKPVIENADDLHELRRIHRENRASPGDLGWRSNCRHAAKSQLRHARRSREESHFQTEENTSLYHRGRATRLCGAGGSGTCRRPGWYLSSVPPEPRED